ncbi:MAG: porin family protein [Polyangiaceae bacterium]|nr:porin family protein [Polyangiaceae bacterium]
MHKHTPKPLPPTLRTLTGIIAAILTTNTASAEEDTTTPITPLRPAPDSLSNHIIIAPKLAYSLPMGNAESQFAQREFTSYGLALGADLAFGINKYIAIHARFETGSYNNNKKCPDSGSCSASTMAFGLGAEYHIVDGAAFDPWIRAGIGYRTMSYKLTLDSFDSRQSYAGFDWLHIATGGDWFPTSIFGFGPYIALDIGKYGKKPDSPPPNVTAERTGAFHTFLSIGIRAVIDPMR